MFYIHQTYCISAQHTFSKIQLDEVIEHVNKKLFALDAPTEGIPLNLLRRMGKAVRMGISAGLPLIQQSPVDGIIIGTANGGMEDCIKFLNQIIDYEEGRLTPTNFVQSTTNAIAAQLGIMNTNKGYNITHVHRGLSFENALIDADMKLQEHPEHSYLLGGIDEISEYNYAIEGLAGWYKKEDVSSNTLYTSGTPGTLPGEGAAMFVVNTKKEGALAQVKAFKVFHTDSIQTMKDQLSLFLQQHALESGKPDLFLSGENGDIRLASFYDAAEEVLGSTPVARYKHMFGDFSTVSALSVWLACQGIQSGKFPEHMYKTLPSPSLNTILLYHTHKENQHSFLLISKP